MGASDRNLLKSGSDLAFVCKRAVEPLHVGAAQLCLVAGVVWRGPAASAVLVVVLVARSAEGRERLLQLSDPVRVVAVGAKRAVAVLGRDSSIVKHYYSIKNSCCVTCVNSAICS
jgi:hypothetical protein